MNETKLRPGELSYLIAKAEGKQVDPPCQACGTPTQQASGICLLCQDMIAFTGNYPRDLNANKH